MNTIISGQILKRQIVKNIFIVTWMELRYHWSNSWTLLTTLTRSVVFSV